MNTCWRKLLDAALAENGDRWTDIEFNTMTYADMEQQFDAGYGMIEGCPFTVWTFKKVYFPVVYDGSETVGWVSRHPDGQPTQHWGGGG